MIQRGNLFSDIALPPQSERFDELFAAVGARVTRIVSHDYRSPEGDWFDQTDDEWVVLLQGQAALEFADAPELETLHPGDYLFIPAGKRHRIAWTSSAPPTIWLAVHVPREPKP